MGDPNRDQTPSPVCVLGFGRSGTSLTMRLLNLLGVQIGPDEDLLAPEDADNSRGYWEPKWMTALNDEILSQLNTTWWRPLPAEPGWEQSPQFDPLRERARSTLEEKFGSIRLWGWKDPRTTLTLPFWRSVVPNAKYVICLRNPADAISSIQRRPEPSLPIQAWGDLWLEYIARALLETHGHPRVLVFYEDFFRDGAAQVERLATFIGLDPQKQDGGSRQLREEIKKDLRHHSTSSLELAAANGIAPAARMLFLALRAAENLRHHTTGTVRADDEQLSDAIERIASKLWTERRSLTYALSTCAETERQIALLLQERELLHNELGRTRQQLSLAYMDSRKAQVEAMAIRSQVSDRRDLASGETKKSGMIRRRLARALDWRFRAVNGRIESVDLRLQALIDQLEQLLPPVGHPVAPASTYQAGSADGDSVSRPRVGRDRPRERL